MSNHSYEQKKQQIEAGAAEALHNLRAERHYSHEDIEKLEEKWKYKAITWIVTTILATYLFMQILG